MQLYRLAARDHISWDADHNMESDMTMTKTTFAAVIALRLNNLEDEIQKAKIRRLVESAISCPLCEELDESMRLLPICPKCQAFEEMYHAGMQYPGEEEGEWERDALGEKYDSPEAAAANLYMY